MKLRKRAAKITNLVASTGRKIGNRLARLQAAIEDGVAAFFGVIGRAVQRVFSAVGRQFAKVGRFIVRISPPWLRRAGRIVRKPFDKLARRTRSYMSRRPHRSFRLTRRRDYRRSLKLPGYWALTGQVWSLLWRNKKLFGGLALVYVLITVALAVSLNGQTPQETYKSLTELMKQTSGDLFNDGWGKVAGAGLLLVTSVKNGLTPDVTAAQSVIGTLAAFFVWLSTVWALRNIMAGQRIGVRDAIYSSGSPVVSSVIVGFFLMLQLIPMALALLVYQSAIETDVINSGVEGMLAWSAVALLGIWSLYWITSTMIALVVVTLPGMYPFQAIRAAGDLVIGRRLRILYRFIWMGLVTTAAWIVVMIPIILFDQWIKKVWAMIDWVPLVPFSLIAMSSFTIIFAATYVYVLYRKVVDDDASPA